MGPGNRQQKELHPDHVRAANPIAEQRRRVDRRIAATPEQNAMRPGSATRLANLWLAGDWTQTGLPATIEGALRSGETAAALAV